MNRGEDLALLSFYKDSTKLSIGIKADYSDAPDYFSEYLPDGMQYRLTPTTKTSQFVFGVAWLDQVTEKNDLQVWFGADSTMSEFQ